MHAGALKQATGMGLTGRLSNPRVRATISLLHHPLKDVRSYLG
jgi:hypothetical protein